MMHIKFSGRFDTNYRELVGKDAQLRDLIADRIHFFKKNPTDTRLQNHALKRRMEGKWAFSITSDIRIIYTLIDKHTARFLAIGPHKQVYTK